MSKKVIYFVIVLFIIFVCVLISSFVINYSNLKGDIKINNKYKEISYLTDSEEIIVNGDMVSIRFSNIKDEIFYDIYNIGNKDAKINSVVINIINTSLDKDKLIIDLNTKAGDFIKGGEIKREVVSIKYTDIIKENDYLNFDVKYSFSE